MPLIISTFSHLAHRIINLCESKISRDRAHAAQLEEESLHGSSAGSAVSSNLKGMTLTPVSSFLSAKGVDPDGVPHGDRGRSGGSDGGGEFAGSGAGAGLGAMSRSLAEVAGYDMVFVEVHAGFAKLMVELSRVFGVR
ncbi:MAG: hypothetical protein M1828_003851 [Chrysothrix sp. TS-e1954]|nr:MAG: hypothetical protein M1828_003851 [Chrysothrix sp. TS-e1954]